MMNKGDCFRCLNNDGLANMLLKASKSRCLFCSNVEFNNNYCILCKLKVEDKNLKVTDLDCLMGINKFLDSELKENEIKGSN